MPRLPVRHRPSCIRTRGRDAPLPLVPQGCTPCRRSPALLSVVATVAAAPYTPASDDVVLERLPEKLDPSLAELKRLRTALVRRPDDTTLAARLARRAIEASRETGDPRFLGQAQAALAPWWNAPDAPVDIVVLRATIRQSLHDFPAALARSRSRAGDRTRARRRRGSPAPPMLTVVGRYDEATRDCDALARLAVELVTRACRAAPASLDGRAAEAYASLASALQRTRRDHAGAGRVGPYPRRGDRRTPRRRDRRGGALPAGTRRRSARCLPARRVRRFPARSRPAARSRCTRRGRAAQRRSPAAPRPRGNALHRCDSGERRAAADIARTSLPASMRRGARRYRAPARGGALCAAARRRCRRALWRWPAPTGRCSAEPADLRILVEAARARRTSDAPRRRAPLAARRTDCDDVAVVAALGERAHEAHRCAARRARCWRATFATGGARAQAERQLSHAEARRRGVQGRWDIALRDLDAAHRPRRQRRRRDHLGRAARARARRSPRTPCRAWRCAPAASRARCHVAQLRGSPHRRRLRGARARRRLPAAARTLDSRAIGLLFDIDPQHRGLLQFVERGRHAPAWSSPADRAATGRRRRAGGALRSSATYVREGVWHIWLGVRPHPVPAVAAAARGARAPRRGAGSRRRRSVPRSSTCEGRHRVHARALDHAVARGARRRCAAVALGGVGDRALGGARRAQQPASRSCAKRRWIAAFAFGLVHGFGFAGALRGSRPAVGLARAFARRLQPRRRARPARDRRGVPAARRSRCARRRAYRRVALAGGSAVIAAVAAVWLVERAFDVPVFAAFAAS